MEDRCVCCGETIPEGRMICYKCEKKEASETAKGAHDEQTHRNK